jgi:hypothetical protein
METNSGGGAARLVITRRPAYVAKVRAFKVLLDGEEIGTLREKAPLTHEIAPGRHELQLKLDWGKSPIEEFEAAPGQEIRYWCRPNGNALSSIYYATFGASRYIVLEPESESPAAT